METTADRILRYLNSHPEGADDDELTSALGLRQRQMANITCRALAGKGLIQRLRRPGQKIRNFAAGAQSVVPRAQIGEAPASERRSRTAAEHSGDTHHAWYWEGNVQSAVVRHLAGNGYDILRVCHTASRERGKDIEARSSRGLLWVTVKGYPRNTEKTQATTQAVHWFSSALFDIICWRGEDPEAELALAFPDFPRYRSLADRISWTKPAARFHILWVNENGTVEIER